MSVVLTQKETAGLDCLHPRLVWPYTEASRDEIRSQHRLDPEQDRLLNRAHNKQPSFSPCGNSVQEIRMFS